MQQSHGYAINDKELKNSIAAKHAQQMKYYRKGEGKKIFFPSGY